MTGGRRVVMAAALGLLASPLRAADPEPKWLGGQLYQENDSLVAGDERYTQGLRLSLAKWQPPGWTVRVRDRLAGKLWPADLKFDPLFSVFFGQNIYTPEIITARDPYPGDRRFAGVLYGGAQLQLTERGQTWRHTFEASVGLLGTASLAGAAQKDLHVLRFRRIPKGWENAPDGVVANTYYRFDRRFAACNASQICFADVTVGGLGALGNVQTAAGVHAAARVGYALTGFPAAAIANAADRDFRPTFELGAIGGWEGRALAYNGLLRPSVDDGTFSTERIVQDKRYGGYVRYKDVRLTILKVNRSAEFEVEGQPRRDQDFASISLSYEPRDVPAGAPRFLLRDWHFELGMGTAPLPPRLADGERRRGPSARVGFAKGIAWDLRLGFDLGGTVVEDEPPAAAPVHRDTFLIYRAVTLGWAPSFARGRLVLRAGPTLFGQLVKVETTDNHLVGTTPVEELSATYQDGGRGGWIAGAQYTHPLQRSISLGLAATYTHLRFREPIPGIASPRFLTTTLAIDVHP
jgi:hypothetical protein